MSAGLDSAVLLAYALGLQSPSSPAVFPGAESVSLEAIGTAAVQPIYVKAGLAWEEDELRAAHDLLCSAPFAGRVLPLVVLQVDMRDVYPPTHWAVRGEAPGYDTPDEDVYIEGRNIVLLAKAGVYMARAKLTRILLGSLAGNPFPDATPEFFRTMGRALEAGLASPVAIEAPFSTIHKAEVIRLGREMAVPLEHTLSCMQSRGGVHCGACSKCRERKVAFREAGGEDPTRYAGRPRS